MNSEQSFCKSRSCPSTAKLLLFEGDKLKTEEIKAVAEHLEQCEFCFAEVQLLTAFRAPKEVLPAPKIPFQLRQLAKNLLDTDNQEQLVLRGSLAKKEFSPLRKEPA